jgi:hypothetical protein
MPAIQLARLKIQATELAVKFNEPEAFSHGLHELLEFYADRTYRPGRSGEPAALIPAYHAPPPVLRQVLHELIPRVNLDRGAGLSLCDALWAQHVVEFCFLAARLLGQVPANMPEPILDRIKAWATSTNDQGLRDVLLDESLAQIRQETPLVFLEQVEAWLFDEDQVIQQMGLRSVIGLLKNHHFENMPVLLRLLAPLMRNSPSKLRPDLLEVVHKLAIQSPKETAYFLRQNLAKKLDNPGIVWLVRNSVRFFPEDIQEKLRVELRGIS